MHAQERYNCPVYLHTHSFGGRVSNRAADVEDCLFDLKLPTGKHSPMHWITPVAKLRLLTGPAQCTGQLGWGGAGKKGGDAVGEMQKCPARQAATSNIAASTCMEVGPHQTSGPSNIMM
eukprot:scaffold69658_cov14-Tisochrysis_lutea.AAC.1